MYTLLREGWSAKTLQLQVPALVATIVVAETFYKFHSFTLEFLAALATWTVIDLVLSTIASVLGRLLPTRRPAKDEAR
jgi:hypothetical protein